MAAGSDGPSAGWTSGQGYTHKELAQCLGVSVTTVKSYRRKFPGFLVPDANGKPLRFPEKTLDACRTIRDGFAESLSVDDIKRKLQQLFKGDGDNDNLSIRAEKRPDPSPDPLLRQDSRWEKIASSTETLAASLDAALRLRGGDEVRLGRLEALMADILGLLNRNHSMHAQLLARLDALADSLARAPDAARPPAGLSGGTGSSGGTGPSGRPVLSAGRPPGDFLDLPVVILSEKGDYLGITAKDGSPFTLREFEQALIRRAAHLAGLETLWKAASGGYVLVLGGAFDREAHEHVFMKTTTNKGNLVALFSALRISGKPVSEAFLRALFRQIKDAME